MQPGIIDQPRESTNDVRTQTVWKSTKRRFTIDETRQSINRMVTQTWVDYRGLTAFAQLQLSVLSIAAAIVACPAAKARLIWATVQNASCIAVGRCSHVSNPPYLRLTAYCPPDSVSMLSSIDKHYQISDTMVPSCAVVVSILLSKAVCRKGTD